MKRSPDHFLNGVLTCTLCGNESLEAISDGEDTNLLCHQCWTCWTWGLGYLIRVEAGTCPACPHKDECIRQRQALGHQSPARVS